MQKNYVISLWGESYTQRVNFFGELKGKEINRFLKNCNIMILPSLSEGFPVAVVEAMKFGIVPLVSYWEGAVADLVLNDQTGYSFIGQNPKSYADCLTGLASDSVKLNSLSKNAKKKVGELFNPAHNTLAYETVFCEVVNNTKMKYSFKALGSRLDNPLIPNIFVFNIRVLISFFSQLMRQ
jgi:glycosyltransferase involved in cell wall biosynthesis